MGIYRQRRTPPPAILQVNKESRLHLQRFYTQCFRVETKRLFQAPVSRYLWVNFDIDTVYCDTNALVQYASDGVAQIQRLILEVDCTDYFLDTRGTALFAASALQTVRILDIEAGLYDETWWTGWADLMRAWYHRCTPLPFFSVTIVAPNRPDGVEVRPDTWQSLDREWRRAHGPTREQDEYYEGISDEEDDVDAPWRFHEYHHLDGCRCASKRKQYVQIGNVDAGKSAWKLLVCAD